MVDSFFVTPGARGKKRGTDTAKRGPPAKRNISNARRPATMAADDEEITSESDDSNAVSLSDLSDSEANESREEEEEEGDKRRRLAKEYLQSLEKEASEAHGFDAADLDRDIVSRRLVQDVAEDQGRVFRTLGGQATLSQVQVSRTRAQHLTSVAAGNWPNVYTVSKGGLLQKWTVSSDRPVLKKMVKIRSPTTGHSGEVVSLAANDKFVASGGRDRNLCIWDAETLESVHVFILPDRHASALCLAFRRGTNELYVGGADLRLHTYDLTQMVFVETLYGHQDGIAAVSALGQERCVTVGQRDRTAIYWKIPEESRLTFRGGDTKLAAHAEKNDVTTVLEGSIDTCAMLDNQLFVTGSDNGNISLWSTQRKKPVFIRRLGHGIDPALPPSRASANQDPNDVEIPPPQPRYITAMVAIPYSDTFFTGSWSGTVNMWRLTEDQRELELVREIRVGKGIVTSLTVSEADSKRNSFRIIAVMSREPRLGRWMRVSGHDAIASFSIQA